MLIKMSIILDVAQFSITTFWEDSLYKISQAKTAC